MKNILINIKRICWRHPRFLRRVPWNKIVIIPIIILIYQYILAQRTAEQLRTKLEETDFKQFDIVNNNNVIQNISFDISKFGNIKDQKTIEILEDKKKEVEKVRYRYCQKSNESCTTLCTTLI